MKTACPEPETIAAFAEGTLRESERSGVEAHLASCEGCVATVAGLLRYLDERAGGPAPRRRSLPRRVIFAIAASLLLALPFIPRLFRPWAEPPMVLRGGGIGPLLAAADLGERPFDPRVMGGFRWTRRAPVRRSGEDRRAAQPYQLSVAAAEVERRERADPTLENRQALGVAHLFMGRLDTAIDVLRSVVREAPSGASSLSDLGAALLARGEAENRPDDLMEALSIIDAALAADAGLEEALFNRAIALEKLHLDKEADAAWGHYLERVPESEWSKEARARRERLRSSTGPGAWEFDREAIEEAADRGDAVTLREIVSRRTQETRLWIQDQLLASWAGATQEGRQSDAERVRVLADALAHALVEATGDPMTRDAVANLGATPRRAALVRGLLAYAKGVEAGERFELREARAQFEEAEAELGDAGNPLALYAAFAVARCQNYEADGERGRDRLDRVGSEAARRGYVALVAHVEWLRGLLDSKAARFDTALASYRRAVELFEQLREEEHAAFLCALMAEDLGFLGDEPASQRRLLDALSGLPRVRTASRRSVILTHAAIGADRVHLPDVALSFQTAALDVAQVSGDATDRADGFLRRAFIAIELGQLEQARDDLVAAGSWTARVVDEETHARLAAELAAAEGRFARSASDPARAIERLTEAIEYFSRARLDPRLPGLLLERARSRRDAGTNLADAERDLRTGIELLEKHRVEVLQAAQRIAYFDAARGLFQEIVSLEISRRRNDSALELLERGKTRDLLDRWQEAPRASLADLPGAIPTGVALIAYGVLPDRLVVWAIANGTLAVVQQPIRSGRLADLVRGFRAELEQSSGNEAPSESARALYDLLIVPVEEKLSSASTWIFVPDDVLHSVAFAALADRRTDRFLVEDHAVLVTPSIALFLHASRNQPIVADARRSLLAVGDPAFDPAEFPDLPRLPAAAEEAERIAALYPQARILTGARATPTAFLQELARHSIVHFSGHALTSDADLLRSRLVLAADPERDHRGDLFAQTLYDRSFGGVRLVILAACSTASGRISSGEGALSLARPFLAGGVPAVVATLWEIEDESSTELLMGLHRGIVAGLPPEQALRRAQVALIEGKEPRLRAPRIWAAFQLSGGVGSALARVSGCSGPSRAARPLRARVIAVSACSGEPTPRRVRANVWYTRARSSGSSKLRSILFNPPSNASSMRVETTAR